MPVEWGKFVETIKRNNRFVLTSHIRPDCDALGSELGMAEILAALGKQVRIVNGQSTPDNIQFIDPQKRILTIGVDVTSDQLRDTDVLIILSTAHGLNLVLCPRSYGGRQRQVDCRPSSGWRRLAQSHSRTQPPKRPAHWL